MTEQKPPPLLFRRHDYTLAGSLAKTVEIKDKKDLATILGKPETAITLKHYMYDERCGWDLWHVVIDRDTVGFTNGPLVENPDE